MIYLSGEAGVDSPFHYMTVITPRWVVHCFHKRWKDILLTSSLPHLVLMYASLCNSLLQLHWRCLPLIAKLPLLVHAQMSLYGSWRCCLCVCHDTRRSGPHLILNRLLHVCFSQQKAQAHLQLSQNAHCNIFNKNLEDFIIIYTVFYLFIKNFRLTCLQHVGVSW